MKLMKTPDSAGKNKKRKKTIRYGDMNKKGRKTSSAASQRVAPVVARGSVASPKTVNALPFSVRMQPFARQYQVISRDVQVYYRLIAVGED